MGKNSEFESVQIGAFRVEINSGAVVVSSHSGYSVTYPALSANAAHIIEFLNDGDTDSVEAIIKIHYSLLSVVFDVDLYVDMLNSLESYVQRNKKSPIPDNKDNSMLNDVKMEHDSFNKLVDVYRHEFS